MLSVVVAGAVKGVAVKSEWITDISLSAKSKFGNGRDCGVVMKKDGISFDEPLVFMLLVLPIRFANLKAADVATVSYVYGCEEGCLLSFRALY
jgi:hypothetical protein